MTSSTAPPLLPVDVAPLGILGRRPRADRVERVRARGSRRAAAALERLKASPASAIGAIQVCITMTNLLLGWIGEPAMSELIRALASPLVNVLPGPIFTAVSTGLSFILVTLLTVVFSELLPKAMTLRFVELAARVTAVPVLAIQRAIYPLVWVMNVTANAVTRPLGLGRVEDFENQQVTIDELRILANQAGADGVVTPRERSIVLNALAIGLRSARQVMVPRLKVQFLDVRRSMDENLEAVNQYLFNRLPLCDGGLDHVIGIVRANEFLAAYYAGGDTSMLPLLGKPPVFVPESLTLDRLLGAFHEHQTEIVLLVDEYGGVEGIVTLQDVVDELLGEPAPLEPQPRGGVPAPGETPATQSLPAPGASTDGEFIVPGDTPVHDLAQRLGRPGWPADSRRPPAQRAVTVAGVLLAHFHRIPRPGEHATFDGVRLRVADADRRVVRRVGVRADPGDAAH